MATAKVLHITMWLTARRRSGAGMISANGCNKYSGLHRLEVPNHRIQWADRYLRLGIPKHNQNTLDPQSLDHPAKL